MRNAVCLLVVLALAVPSFALTPDQKTSDFLAIAAVYAKRYAPGEWKQQLFQTNPGNLQPWLAEVAATPNDLAYLDVVVRYVASLKDTHSAYRVNTSFFANLGFHVDVYSNAEGQPVVLIDSITRSLQPISRFPVDLGDELVSVDGVSVADWIERFRPYVGAGNRKSETRIAAGYITSRSQTVLPMMVDLGDTANVQVRRRSGAVEVYTLSWSKSGIPLREIPGPSWTLPSAPAKLSVTEATEETLLEPLRRMINERDHGPREILNYASRTPIWRAPSSWQQRAGQASADLFWTGIAQHRDKRIGIIRIPTFAPASTFTAIRQLETELTFMNENTDGLVIDVTRNNGGDPCYAENVLAMLMDKPWQAFGRRYRVTWDDIASLDQSVAFARILNSSNLPFLEARLTAFREAYEGNRLTPPLSNCAMNNDREPSRTVQYTKPVVLLTDEFSTSAADYFPAIFQDNERGPIYGFRTNGAGGGIFSHRAGFLSEAGTAFVTGTMHHRNRTVTVDGFPETNFTENVGVHPTIVRDLMTVENFRDGGASWTLGFLDAIVDRINQ